MLKHNMDEVIQTLEREEMKLEVIFREIINGEEYHYWFAIQGDTGEEVTASPYEVDQKHIAYHEECIDHTYGSRDAQPQVVMVPTKIAQAMDWSDLPAMANVFEKREIIYRRN